MAWTTPRTWSVGEVVTAAIQNTHVRDNFLALYPDFATTLPGSPYDNKFATLTDSVSAPTWWWTFRYVSAISTNKWLFQSGTPMTSAAADLVQVNTTTYRYTGTLLTVPRSGLYDAAIVARDGYAGNARPRYTIGVNGAADDTYSSHVPSGGGQLDPFGPYRHVQRRTFTSGDQLSLAYRVEVTGISTQLLGYTLQLTPVQVS